MLPTGLYEQIISKALDRELAISGKRSQTARIDEAEAAKVLAKYVAEIVEKGLENVKDNGGDLNNQVDLVNPVSCGTGRAAACLVRYEEHDPGGR